MFVDFDQLRELLRLQRHACLAGKGVVKCVVLCPWYNQGTVGRSPVSVLGSMPNAQVPGTKSKIVKHDDDAFFSGDFSWFCAFRIVCF